MKHYNTSNIITEKNTTKSLKNKLAECRGCNLQRDKYLAPMSKYFQIDMLISVIEKQAYFKQDLFFADIRKIQKPN